ncbi:MULTISPECIES: flagellar protein FlaG [unclassified Halomonas]|uniref:flagellar protein FlaG n=1 Tax=unclassified Halomonas TaxID=2609666 RepID=UPI00209DCEAA|nr:MULTISPECIES: flagellar protein FlaG [unclassified Halomonas]MCP1314803.1 flagellar protein FlaG [Halomonas sp. 707D7]MCP1325794.1 flagellar protein FlaG [Halomonas sp. 707D4]
MDSLPLDSSLAPATASASQLSPQQAQTLRQEIEARATAVPASTDTRAVELSREELEEPIERINNALRPRGLEFDVSDESSRIIARVIDRETGDVIRQIPGEEVLAVARRIEEMQSGLISIEA